MKELGQASTSDAKSNTNMNSNFLGAPIRQDIQALEVLRNRIMIIIGLLDKMYTDMHYALFHGQAISFPAMMRIYSKATSQLASVNAYLNGFYKHREEGYRDANGRPIIDQDGNQLMRYTDAANEGAAERVEALHVFPQAPFPMDNARLAGLAEVILNKRLGPPEEKWVRDKLRKAAEFAHVPGEWGIEPKKAAVETEVDEDDDSKGDVADISTKRFKGALRENEISELWAVGHKTAFDRQYQRHMQFEKRAAGEAAGDEDGAEKGVEDEDEASDGYEDMEDGDDDEFEDALTPRAAASAPVVVLQRGPRSIHKPVPGVPVMSMGAVHRFMISGMVAQVSRR